MSMTTFMIWQMIGIFCAYFGVTLILPLVVFRRLLKGRTITNQIVFSFLIGNFYIITMVQILQLLKISHTVTLILATVVPAYIVWVKLNKVSVGEKLETFGTNVKRVTEKYLGYKTAGVRVGKFLKRESRKCAKKIIHFFFENWIEVLLQLGLFLVLLWVYGVGIIEQYGYSASDIPVHNYWINAMGDNNIFVAGVYPHGYHCMIYYLHEVFCIDTYIILSLFAFVQVICVHFALLYFLRLCCKAKYVPYIGAFLYAAGDFFRESTYFRFGSTLPQEFGMIFILPAIYYGFEFFEVRYQEVKNGEKKKSSWYSLFGFAMSFGLTLSAHFYNTVIAGLFCVAMAIGYLFLLVKKEYFGNVVLTCLISILVAILPMGIAFATGTPLQGSLYWATSVMTSGSNDEEDESNSIQTEVQNNVQSSTNNQNNKQPEISDNSADLVVEPQGNAEVDPPIKKVSVKERLENKIDILNQYMKDSVWSDGKALYCILFWIFVAASMLGGVIFIVFREFCYGAKMISCALYAVIMAILLASGGLGIPRLMDPARACIYFAYAVPILFVIPIDAIIGGCIGRISTEWIERILSGCVLIAFGGTLIICGHLRQSHSSDYFETNEAITCLTNIMQRDKEFTWTICSANDEFRMCEENGYHYEIITFLRQMENWDEDKRIIIPTPNIYFFIEKVPLDYTVSYDKSGQKVSEEGADRKLSMSGGLKPYQGENRWITMSKMYYWAQEFQRMYPNEMKVYMETDNFVCYVLEQNTYSLLNLAIDYGYNTEEK